MKKGLSPIVSAILILLIAISVTLLAIIWLPRFTFNISPPLETEFNNSYMLSRSCLSIDNIDSINNILALKNCGKTSLQGFTFYIDGLTTNLQLDKLDPQESANINYGHIPKGNHNFYITADYAETSIINFYEIGVCDFIINQSDMTNTYSISQSNKVYCLGEDIQIGGRNAINFSSGVQSATLACQYYNIEGDGTGGTFGIYMTGSTTKNNVIIDCAVTNFYEGLYVENSNNNLFTDSTFNDNYYGIRFFGAGHNNLNNITVYSNSNGLEIDSGDYNNFVGITAASNSGEGLYFGSSNYNALTNINSNYNNDGLNINAASVNNIFSYINANYNNNYGFFLNGTTGNSLTNVNASYNGYGLYLLQASNNNIINSAANYNGVYGFIIQANSNTLINNAAIQNGDTGIILNGSYNALTGNNVNGNGFGIEVISGSNNITGGSVINNTNNAMESNPADYAINQTSTSNFTGTNFTDARKIFFYGTASWFNYQNTTANNIWLKTNVSAAATIIRKLTSWSLSAMKWNDTPNTTITARYNITGLLATRQYNVYNTSAGIQTNPYTLTADSNGALNFTIKLNGNTEILVNTTADVKPPVYFFNSTNSTSAGTPIMHSLYWQDDTGLSGYIFQFCNGTWNGSICSGQPSNWLSGWQYRKQHNINIATGADVNYTIKITVINGTGTDSGNTVYINNKARVDFGDIRFTDSTSNLLNYWMESVNNGVNATFWVQISGNLTTNNQKIYIYYGNPTATNLSNGANTFPFFDDFVGSSLDTSKWQVYSTGNGYSVSSSQLALSYATSYTWLRVQSISAFNTNYAFRMRFHTSDFTDYNKPIFLEWMDSTTGENGATYFGFYKNDYQDRFWRAYNGTTTESYDIGTADNNWHIADVDRANSSLANCYYDNNFEQNLNASVTGGNKIIDMKIGASAWMNYGNYILYIDWVAVRKYVYPEPAHGAWGSEETVAVTSLGWVNDTWQPMTGTTSWSNVTKTVNSTTGATVAWCVYANDTSSNWNGTSCSNPFTYTTTSIISFSAPVSNPTLIISNNTATVNTIGLVGYWKFDEGIGDYAFDKSGNGNTALLATWAQTVWGKGKYGEGISVPTAVGYNNEVFIDSIGDLYPVTNTSQNTISFWINATGDDGDAADYNNMIYFATDGGIDIRVLETASGDDTCVDNNGIWNNVCSSSPIPLNQWVHVAVVYNNRNVQIYHNGVLVGSGTLPNIIPSSGTMVAFQADTNCGGCSWPAYQGDELMIFNRSLSADEIRELYQSTVPSGTQTNFSMSESNTGDSDVYYDFYRSGSVSGIWHFDEGTGFYAFDDTGNNNTGITHGMNLITNPGFEMNTGKYPIGWGWGYGNFQIVTDVKYDGNASARFQSLAADGTVQQTDSVDIPVSANENIIVSLYSKGQNIVQGASSNSWDNAYVYGRWIDSSGNEMSGLSPPYTDYPDLFIGNVNGIGTWNWERNDSASENGAPYQVPPGAVYYEMTLSLGYNATGTLWIDDVQVEKSSSVTPYRDPWVNGKYGKALHLTSSSSNYISVSNSNSLKPSNITVEVWFKLDTFTNWARIIEKDYYPDYSYALLLGNNNNIGFALRIGTTEYNVYSDSNTIVAGNWYHVVATYDNSNMKIYINGNQNKTNAVTGQINYTNNSDLNIGRSHLLGGTNYIDGTIDELKIYPRALSPAEVLCHYGNNCSQAGFWNETATLPAGSYYYVARASGGQNYTSSSLTLPLVVTSSPPILWFKFNEANGTKTYDSSGNGFIGTFQGETFNDGVLGSSAGADSSDPARVSGKYGNALQFDGINDYVSLPEMLPSNNLFTVGLWFKTRTNGTLISEQDKQYPNVDPVLQMYDPFLYVETNGKLHGGICCPIPPLESSYEVNDNNWHYAALVVNGTNQSLYVDGNFVNFNSSSIPEGPFNYLDIGTGYALNWPNTNNNWSFFNGTIDEVRVWNRTLSQTEIRNEMQSSLPTSRTLASYSFEESGQYANDTHIWVNGTNGTNGSALSFDGNNDYVTVGNNPSLNAGTGNLTVGLWFKSAYKGGLTSYWQTMVSKKGGSTTDAGYCVGFYNDTGVFGVYFNVGNGTVGDVATYFTSPYSVVDNNWHYATGVWEYRKSLKIYIDGLLENTDSVISLSGSLNNALNLEIGHVSSDTEWFNGSIDDLRIWNRSLSASEILNCYQNGC